MGNSYAGQLKATRFEEVLHNSIEASLRSNNLVPRPVFSQLYLEAEQQLSSLEGGSRVDNEEEEEEGEGGPDPNGPPNPYQLPPAPEGCCTTDGFCQAGKDLRLVSMSSEPVDVPAGFLLVGAKSPSLPDHLLVCAVDKRFLPDDNGHNALLGFSGNCVGCGKKGFCYFTDFSNHINLKLTTQPKKQKHLKYYLVRNAQGTLTKGPLICWKGSEFRSRQSSAGTCSSSLFLPLDSSGPLAAFPSESVPGTNPGVLMGAQQAGPAPDHPSLTSALGPAVFNGKDSPKHQQLAKSSLSAPPRPSALGILPNSGPPKKRHKGWSPESPSATDGGYSQSSGNRAKYESAGVSCVPQAGLVGPASVSFPVVASGEPVSVPDNLLKICKAKPVIFKGKYSRAPSCGGGRLEEATRVRQKCDLIPHVSSGDKPNRAMKEGSSQLPGSPITCQGFQSSSAFHRGPKPRVSLTTALWSLVHVSFPSSAPRRPHSASTRDQERDRCIPCFRERWSVAGPVVTQSHWFFFFLSTQLTLTGQGQPWAPLYVP